MSVVDLFQDDLDSTWACRMEDGENRHSWSPWSHTPEEAVARCLVALVEAQDKEAT